MGITFLLSGYASAQQSSGLLHKWVHPGNGAIKENGYEGAQTCAMCHQNALDEIVRTAHWPLSSPVRNVQGLPDSTWWGMANRECALAGSTSPSNWTASTNGRATVQAAGCGVCHIASLPQAPLRGATPTYAEKNTVDCLVCHAKNGVMDFRALGYTPAQIKTLETTKQPVAG